MNDKAISGRTSASVLVWMIGFCAVWALQKMFAFPETETVAKWIEVGELFLAGAVLFRIRWRGNGWYIALLLALALIFVTSAIRSDKILKRTESVLMKGVLVYLLCPAVALLVSGADLKRFLRVFAAVWVGVWTALAVAGIWCAVTGARVPDASGKGSSFLGMEEGMLHIFDTHTNVTAAHLAVSMMVALFGFSVTEARAGKALFLASALPLFIALTMTGCRSGELAASVGAGGAVVCLMQKPLMKKINRKGLRILLSLLLILVLAAAGLLVISGTHRAVNAVLRADTAFPGVSRAYAEEADAEREAVQIRERDFFGSENAGFLTLRQNIWLGALRAVREDPSILLKGGSVPDWKNLPAVKKFFPSYASHCHNMPLQILMETGLAGLLLCGVFLFFVIRAAARLFPDLSRPLWERFLALPVAAVAVIETVETITRLNGKAFINIPLMLFAGVMIVRASAGSAKRG